MFVVVRGSSWRSAKAEVEARKHTYPGGMDLGSLSQELAASLNPRGEDTALSSRVLSLIDFFRFKV